MKMRKLLNGDGVVDVLDTVLLKKQLVGIE